MNWCSGELNISGSLEFCELIAMQRKEGLVHILTGDGNGKTTSAVGLAVRASGRGLRVAFINYGRALFELVSLEKLRITVISKTKHCTNKPSTSASFRKKGL